MATEKIFIVKTKLDMRLVEHKFPKLKFKEISKKELDIIRWSLEGSSFDCETLLKKLSEVGK